jgi:hypothetical protein
MKKGLILFIVIGFILVGCKSETNNGISTESNRSNAESAQGTNPLDSSITGEFELYNGKTLKVAVIGTSPQIREEQVVFNEISFEELTKGEMVNYDAVFVMKERLIQASNSQYADFYLNSDIPVFFISANSHLPFTLKDTEYSQSWEWTPGNMFATGVIKDSDNGSLKELGVGLYNDEKTNEHIKATYSLVFKQIEEISL